MLCVQEKQDKGSFLRLCIGIFEVIGRHVMNRYKKPMILNIRVFRENSFKHFNIRKQMYTCIVYFFKFLDPRCGMAIDFSFFSAFPDM
jgi:hypothetical protein